MAAVLETPPAPGPMLERGSGRLLAESVRFGARKLVTALSRKILQQVQ